MRDQLLPVVKRQAVEHVASPLPQGRARRSWVVAALCALCACALAALALPMAAMALPDGRAYEMVTPPDKNGVETGAGIPSVDGNTVNWEAIGGCCGATGSAVQLYQSTRSASGWQTSDLTPKPPTPLVGLFAEQAPLWWSPDLSQTIFTTPASYAAGDQRPPAPGAGVWLDLYLERPGGSLTWLSQGPFAGAGTGAFTATFEAATADGNHVGFTSQERLTPDATGLADLNTPPQFVYERNVDTGTTDLVNIATTTLSADAAAGDTSITVASTSAFAAGQSMTIGTGSGQETVTIDSVTDATHIALSSALTQAHAAGSAVEALISPDGAILGNGNYLGQGFLAGNYFGTTTNSISSDGTKLFFASPPTFPGGSGSAEGVGSAHLYMRDEATNTTTPLDNPASQNGAQYEGASTDGSLVFFTSNEGLGGNTNTDNELYEFNTTNSPIGPAQPMSVYPVSGGSDGTADGNVLGATAISNDGSHVYFAAEGVLAGNANAQGATATAGQPNLYEFNTQTGQTTFIAPLDERDVASCIPNCDTSRGEVLAGEPDIARPAITTPDGSVLVFDSRGNETNQNPSGPSTTLTADVSSGANTITVASTAGIVPGRAVFIQSPTGSDQDAVTGVIDAHTLQLSGTLIYGHSAGESVSQLAPYELYRFSNTDGSLACISCPPTGVPATGSATLGATGGGSYMPPGQGTAMSSDGSKIFFNTPDPLVPGDTNTGIFATGIAGGLAQGVDVYEWEGGTTSLISDGHSTTGSYLGGTTPSGNDAIFTTQSQLVGSDGDGYDDIYDARVGGGFPSGSGGGGAACSDPASCRTGVAPTVFFSVPGSATLIAPNVPSPTFTVASITANQRKQAAKTGKLTLKVTTNAPGQVRAAAFARLHGLMDRMSYESHTFWGVNGGSAKMTVKLDKSGRNTLKKSHKLTVRIEVSFSKNPNVLIAYADLKTKKPKKKKKSHSVKGSLVRSAHGDYVRGA